MSRKKKRKSTSEVEGLTHSPFGALEELRAAVEKSSAEIGTEY